jgi:hypothetical protein
MDCCAQCQKQGTIENEFTIHEFPKVLYLQFNYREDPVTWDCRELQIPLTLKMAGVEYHWASMITHEPGHFSSVVQFEDAIYRSDITQSRLQPVYSPIDKYFTLRDVGFKAKEAPVHFFSIRGTSMASTETGGRASSILETVGPKMELESKVLDSVSSKATKLIHPEFVAGCPELQLPASPESPPSQKVDPPSELPELLNLEQPVSAISEQVPSPPFEEVSPPLFNRPISPSPLALTPPSTHNRKRNQKEADESPTKRVRQSNSPAAPPPPISLPLIAQAPTSEASEMQVESNGIKGKKGKKKSRRGKGARDARGVFVKLKPSSDIDNA